MFDDATNNSTPATPNTPIAPAPTVNPGGGATQKAGGASEEQVYTMPMEYYLGDKTTAGAPSAKPAGQGRPAMAPQKKKKILNIVIGAVLAVVVIASGWLLFRSYQAPAETEKPAVVNKAPAVTPEAPKVETAPAVTATEPKVEVTMEELEKKIAETKAEQVKKFDPADIKKFSLSLLAGPDGDKDGLTNAEEALFKTNPDMVDTDADVYKDKEEITNFYSPIDAGPIRLWEKSLIVSEYANAPYGYKLLYPAGWLIQPLDEKNPNDLMISSNQNEFINIIIDSKKAGQALADWYLEKAPTASKADIKTYTTYKKNLVVESPDAFTVYFSRGNDVIIVNYNIGLKEEAGFPTVFEMLVNSLEFVEPSALPAEAGTGSAGTEVPPVVAPVTKGGEVTPPPVQITE